MVAVMLGLSAEYAMAVTVCSRTGFFMSMYMDTVGVEVCLD